MDQINTNRNRKREAFIINRQLLELSSQTTSDLESLLNRIRIKSEGI